MPAGKYYIGDLCYVMHDAWDEAVSLMFPHVPGQPERKVDGEFTLADGRRFASFGTAYGDGTYRSSIGTEHSVDSGSIGCIRVEDICDDKYDNIEALGAIIDFPESFEVLEDTGMLVFGHVKIETNEVPWEEYDEQTDS